MKMTQGTYATAKYAIEEAKSLFGRAWVVYQFESSFSVFRLIFQATASWLAYAYAPKQEKVG